MACNINETSLIFPAEFVKKCCGLAIDMGGSVTKIVYRTKENLEEASKPDAKTGHLQLASLSREYFDEALDYIQKNATLPIGGEPLQIFTTGLGCTQYGKAICEKLNVKLENLLEFDCFVKAIHYLLSNVSRADLLEPYLEEEGLKALEEIKTHTNVVKEVAEQGQSGMQGLNINFDVMSTLGKVTNDSSLPVAEAEKDLYPFLLVMGGSGIGFMKVNADGTFQMLDGSPRGGKLFHGLGSLLTGCKSFDELVDLAEKGDSQAVDLWSGDLFKGCESGGVEGEDNMYSKSAKAASTLVYSFGKGVNKSISDFKREDLAAAVLWLVVLDIVHLSSSICGMQKIQRILFTGSFMNSAVARKIVTSEMAKRNMFSMAFTQHVTSFDFVKSGGHMGAIGALISQFEKNK